MCVRVSGVTILLGVSLGLAGCAHVNSAAKGTWLTAQERRDAIRRAAVWSPTDIPNVDFKAGPEGIEELAPDEWLSCDYKPRKFAGASPKFACETSSGDELKVKYGERNAEVFGEVLSSRLFWALGFPADRMYPVRVRCRGCPKDPKADPTPTQGVVEFELAAIERKLPGRAMETSPDSGWKWPELEELGPETPPNARAERDALKLLAAFIQHNDSKASNQRLLCPEGQEVGQTGCRAPVLMIADLGLTFGRGGLLLEDKNKNSVSLADWTHQPVWTGGAGCVAHLEAPLSGGSLGNPQISEAGRAFLAGLLVQLSDAQLHDLFEVARVNRRSSDPSSDPNKDGPPPSVDEWVTAFKLKRAQVVDKRCPQ